MLVDLWHCWVTVVVQLELDLLGYSCLTIGNRGTEYLFYLFVEIAGIGDERHQWKGICNPL